VLDFLITGVEGNLQEAATQWLHDHDVGVLHGIDACTHAAETSRGSAIGAVDWVLHRTESPVRIAVLSSSSHLCLSSLCTAFGMRSVWLTVA
jgi:hypothetical protein